VSREHSPAGGCSPEGCQCPWDDAGVCERGCAVENLEIEMPRDIAAKQLCAPGQGESFAKPVPPGFVPEPADAEVLEAFCEVERYRCERGIVSRCDSGQARPMARCNAGCVQGEGLIVEDVPGEVASALLCLREGVSSR